MAKSGLYCWNVLSWCLYMILIMFWYPIAYSISIFGAWGLAYDPAFDLAASLKFPEMHNFGLSDL